MVANVSARLGSCSNVDIQHYRWIVNKTRRIECHHDLFTDKWKKGGRGALRLKTSCLQCLHLKNGASNILGYTNALGGLCVKRLSRNPMTNRRSAQVFDAKFVYEQWKIMLTTGPKVWPADKHAGRNVYQ